MLLGALLRKVNRVERRINTMDLRLKGLERKSHVQHNQ